MKSIVESSRFLFLRAGQTCDLLTGIRVKPVPWAFIGVISFIFATFFDSDILILVSRLKVAYFLINLFKLIVFLLYQNHGFLRVFKGQAPS